MQEVIKCKKCGRQEFLINNLCRSCYQKYVYRKNKYGIKLQDFIFNDCKNHHKDGNPPKVQDEIIKQYFESANGVSIANFCKQQNISRQTYYNRVKVLGLKKN